MTFDREVPDVHADDARAARSARSNRAHVTNVDDIATRMWLGWVRTGRMRRAN
tara:strand:- start:10074 stop:10232 length:159 start_codon:yes stop_codon:yes gene_type:complete